MDKFQGQQNDYILLSLVRTKTVGHLRDVRRLVVAMSRARLGLYVFARVSVFNNCYELAPSFNLLTKRSQVLELLPSESFATERKVDELPSTPPFVVKDMAEMMQFVYHYYQQKIEQWKVDKPEMFQDKGQEEEEEVMEVEPTRSEEVTLEKAMEEDVHEDGLGFEKLTEDDTGEVDEQEVASGEAA